jgi:hypothetical protein
MKKATTAIATISLLGAYGTAMAGADKCMDCHEAADFAGTPTAGLVDAIKKMRDTNPKHKATANLSDEDIAKIVADLEKASGG